jgi:multidrug transporter EmrE-like cation transporter
MTSGTRAYIALAFSIILNSAALLFIKAAVITITGATLIDPSVGFFIKAALSPWLWAGVFSFIGSLYLWTISLKVLDLSLAYPTSSISYIAIAVVSHLLFDEVLTIMRVVGMALIMCGVYFLYLPRKEKPVEV